MSEPKKIDYYCAECGSRNVIRDATAKWNISAQAWELAGLQDLTFCDECSDYVELKEVEL